MLRKILILLSVLIMLFVAYVCFDYSRDISAARARIGEGCNLL
jgi:hypothetical protein